MNVSNNITVRFPFQSVGVGSIPTLSDFNEKEKEDLRKVITLHIDWDPDCLENRPEAKIVKVCVLYDGITRIQESDVGLWLDEDDGCLCGYPAPILEFELDQAMDVEEFVRAIRASWVGVCTSSMRDNDEDALSLEDENGYVHALDDEQHDEYVEYLEDDCAMSGRVFKYPEGMPEGGEPIPAIDFALPPRD